MNFLLRLLMLLFLLLLLFLLPPLLPRFSCFSSRCCGERQIQQPFPCTSRMSPTSICGNEDASRVTRWLIRLQIRPVRFKNLSDAAKQSHRAAGLARKNT